MASSDDNFVEVGDFFDAEDAEDDDARDLVEEATGERFRKDDDTVS